MPINRIKDFWQDWKIGEILGEGSYGKVYSAQYNSEALDATAAIKVISIPVTNAEFDALRSEGMTESETKKYFEGIAKDFINEIKVMNTLKGAPNIVAVEDFKILEKTDRVGWDIFIRMELLKSFKSYLDVHRPTEEEVVKLGIDIATALEVCQERHIIHRDIKPANIFIDDFGNFKLGDFGIAKELEKTTGAASSKGTFSFMAPEVARGTRYDSTVDIYSLGLVMYSLLNNNRPPFVDPNSSEVTYNDRKEANDRRLSGEPLPAPCNASKDLANIILTACAYDPAQRYNNPTTFLNALKNYINKKNNSTVQQTTFKKETDINQTITLQQHSSPKTQIITHSDFSNEKSLISSNTQKQEQIIKNKALIITFIIVLLFIAVFLIIKFILTPSNEDTVINENTDVTVKSIPEIHNVEFQGMTGDVEWYYGDNTLLITGDGKMGNYEFGNGYAPWEDFKTDINKLIISYGVTNIGNSSFRGCTSLEDISITNTVTSIDDMAFYDCTSITEIDLPDNLIKIGNNVFYQCKNLENISIPDTVTSIGEYAFYNCESLSRVTMHDGITTIEKSAFSGCKSLYSVQLPNTLTKISSSLFSSCESITSITIPENVTSLEDNAFYNCTSLEKIIIPNSLNNIGKSTFEGCTNLEIINLPQNMTMIGESAFRDCSSLKTIIIPEGISIIAQYTFTNCESLEFITFPESLITIDLGAFWGCEDFTIKCPENSYIESYLKNRYYNYVTY